MTNRSPAGQLFSRAYIEQSAPSRTLGPRAKTRLCAARPSVGKIYDFAKKVATEIGYTIDGGYDFHIDISMHKASDDDLLDILTLIWRCAKPLDRASWVETTNRIFREENIQFIMDEQGGIHPFEDEVFDEQRQATLKHLADPRYESVLTKYEQAYAALLQAPPNTGDCLDKIFEALEAFMKLVDDGKKFSRLDTNALKKVLEPFCLRHITPHSEESAVARQMVEGMKFVFTMHPYRHGQEKTPRPTMQLTIACLGICTAFLRYLLEVDQLATAEYGQ